MACKRCGACCYFTREWVDGKEIRSNPCPFLIMKDGLASCLIYETRPPTCRFYNCENAPFFEGQKWSSDGVKRELGL